MTQPITTSDEIQAPDISHLVLEDDAPVDNFQSEKQQRLLVDPLYSSPFVPTPFIAAANVGIFYAINQEGIAPDAFLSLGVQMPEDWSQRQNRSYLVWELGKVPEVAIEIVSNRKGKELGSKQADYARMKVDYYVVFDPLRQIQEAQQMNGALLRVWALTAGRYVELTPAEGGAIDESIWLDTVNIGLTLWEGTFEAATGLWLRWCDQNGQVIPTGKERAEQAELERDREHQRAEQARQRAEQLAERLRALGINPDEI